MTQRVEILRAGELSCWKGKVAGSWSYGEAAPAFVGVRGRGCWRGLAGRLLPTPLGRRVLPPSLGTGTPRGCPAAAAGCLAPAAGLCPVPEPRWGTAGRPPLPRPARAGLRRPPARARCRPWLEEESPRLQTRLLRRRGASGDALEAVQGVSWRCLRRRPVGDVRGRWQRELCGACWSRASPAACLPGKELGFKTALSKRWKKRPKG